MTSIKQQTIDSWLKDGWAQGESDHLSEKAEAQQILKAADPDLSRTRETAIVSEQAAISRGAGSEVLFTAPEQAIMDHLLMLSANEEEIRLEQILRTDRVDRPFVNLKLKLDDQSSLKDSPIVSS